MSPLLLQVTGWVNTGLYEKIACDSNSNTFYCMFCKLKATKMRIKDTIIVLMPDSKLCY